MPFGRTAKKQVGVVRDELGQSIGHFRTAAAHAAQGAADKIGPRMDGAMVTVGLRKPAPRKRWPWVAGALGLGAAAGVAVMAMAKRREGQWDDYTVAEATDDFRDASRDATSKTKSFVDDTAGKAKHLAEKVQGKTDQMADKARDKAGDVGTGDRLRSGAPGGMPR